MNPDRAPLPTPPPGPDSAPSRGLPAQALRRLLLLYVPFALAWILGTDLLIGVFASDLADAVWYSALKGVVFVLVTALILYLVTMQTLGEWNRANAIFRAVVEQAPDLIVRLRLDPEMQFEYMSPASVRLGGYTPEEFYENPELVFGSVHPDDAETLRTLLSEPSVDTQSALLRWIHRDDGSTVWTDTRVTWEMDEAGRPTTALAFVRDVTARYEAERTARLLATAVEAAGEAVLVTDGEGTIEYVNPTFERLSGYTAAEAIGQSPKLLRSGQQSGRFYAQLWSTLLSGGTFRGHFINRRKNGQIYDQHSTITPVMADDGKPSHFVSVSRDVTIEREIHRQLAASEKSAAVAQLAAGMAHDFRNLLNVVSANVELLRAAPGGESKPAAELADIEAAAAAGSDLVTRLLNIARPSRAEREVLRLPTLVSDMEGILRAAIARSIDLSLSIDDEVQPVRVDQVQIEQALLNLVRNASQAMPEGGTLTVEVATADWLPASEDVSLPPAAFVRLTVADTGKGMDSEAMARAYDPFFTTKETGTGLGVPMVRRAVEDHGGFMAFESEVGVGTAVSLFVPAADTEEAVAVADAARQPAGTTGGRERILLAEDDPSLRRVADRMLSRLGYDVTSVADGLEAIERIERGERWDLILADLIMPRLGGADLFQRLRERDIDMPMIFMSGQDPQLIRGVVRGASVTGFLAKPWTAESLAGKVREALDAR